MNETWRDIAGYENLYQVSNLGRVKSLWYGRERILKLAINRNGYLRASLYKDGKPVAFYVHRLVAEAFLPNPGNKPEVNHLNGIKTDNRVENLEWATRNENVRHAFSTGLYSSGEGCSYSKLTNEQVEFIRNNPDNLTGRQLAEMLNVHENIISKAQRGEIYKNAGGAVRESKQKRVPTETCEKICREYVRGSREFGCVALGEKYGVHPSTILRIVKEVSA